MGCADDVGHDPSHRSGPGTTTPAPTPTEIPPAPEIDPPPLTLAQDFEPMVGVSLAANPAGRGIPFHDLPRRLGKVLCDKIFGCCGRSEATLFVLGTKLTPENCPDVAPYNMFGDYFEHRSLSVADGQLEYDPRDGTCQRF
jgi:hypothetical protein